MSLEESSDFEHAKKVVLGSSGFSWPGWAVTDRDTLDVVSRDSFLHHGAPGTIDAFLAEHVWEHLTPDEVVRANRNCYEFLRPGGHLRIAVPDGYHPDPSYIDYVRPGGSGAGAGDHKALYNYRSLGRMLREAGFLVDLLEYWDEFGRFHYKEWSSAEGHVMRSRRYDRRNQDGSLSFTSLIVDAIKPPEDRLDGSDSVPGDPNVSPE